MLTILKTVPPKTIGNTTYGVVIHTAYTHYMEAQDVAGEQRRFDLVGSIVNISNYELL